MDARRSGMLRLAQLLTLVTLAVASCALVSEAARSDKLLLPQAGSFHDRIQQLRKLSEEATLTQKLMESLDELDDIQLTQLRVPKAALTTPTGGRQLHAGYGGEGHQYRQLLQGPYPGQRRSLAAYP